MDIFHSIRLEEITEEDFINLSMNIDKNSDVYQIFRLIFRSMKKVEEPNELSEKLKSYGFPTSRGVEYSLVQFEESDDLKIVCTMPVSKTSPEWVKKYVFDVGECVKEKWSVVFKNSEF